MYGSKKSWGSVVFDSEQFLIQNPELPNSFLVFISISTSLSICTGIYI